MLVPFDSIDIDIERLSIKVDDLNIFPPPDAAEHRAYMAAANMPTSKLMAMLGSVKPLCIFLCTVRMKASCKCIVVGCMISVLRGSTALHLRNVVSLQFRNRR